MKAIISDYQKMYIFIVFTKTSMTYTSTPGSYEKMKYNRCGRSGIRLPELSLGLWHNFGGVDNFDTARSMVLEAFDNGITHFDLANNYGPPPGSAESTFGEILKSDLQTYRDEIIISTKAGYLMWPGPYGEWGSRKYLTASLDQSLKRMGLEYVDIFYSHRYDPETPLEETMGALASAVKNGKALYAGISNYPPEETAMAADILHDLGCPCLIHQVKYSLLQPQAGQGLDKVLIKEGIGCIAFSPLGQGILSNRYLDGIPKDSRAGKEHGFLREEEVNTSVMKRVSLLNNLAGKWNMSLADLALNWVRSQKFITSVLVGISSLDQLRSNLKLIDMKRFSSSEMEEINALMK